MLRISIRVWIVDNNKIQWVNGKINLSTDNNHYQRIKNYSSNEKYKIYYYNYNIILNYNLIRLTLNANVDQHLIIMFL